jgi:selenocysteine lyase/cysteine desulfurase
MYMHTKDKSFLSLENSICAALETYSNVHRGSGHNSMVTTHLFEKARKIVLDYLGLKKGRYVVIFCTPFRAELLKTKLNVEDLKFLTSKEIGLSLGVVAIAVEKRALPKGIPFHVGGGTTRLLSREWVIWSDAPDRFEAGTPAIINIIAFAKALLLIRDQGNNTFSHVKSDITAVHDIMYKDDLEKYSGNELLAAIKQELIGMSVMVPTLQGQRHFINLDNGASTPTFPPVLKAFCQAMQLPQIYHQSLIREAKAICAEFLGSPLSSYDIIFTSNTTEAINLVSDSFKKGPGDDHDAIAINTLLEHNSNELPWRSSSGQSMVRIKIDANGFIDLKELEDILRSYNEEAKFDSKRIKLVTVSGASNVLGICNDLGEISRITHKYGAQLLVDVAQLVAHRPVQMDLWGIDYLAFSGHKTYAPFGSGALVARKGLLNFSDHEMALIKSSGEENVAGIAALGKAFVLLQRIGMDKIMEEEQALTRKALEGMANVPGLNIYGIKDPDSLEFSRKAGVIAFNIKNSMGNVVAKKLASEAGIGIRYGCHCSHILVKHILKVGPGLERFQKIMLTLLPKVQLPGVARISLGIENTEKDINELIRNLVRIADRKNSNLHGKPVLSKADFKAKMHDFIKESEEKVFGTL